MQMGGLCVQYYPGSLPEGGRGGGRIILQVKLDLKIILLAIAHIHYTGSHSLRAERVPTC